MRAAQSYPRHAYAYRYDIYTDIYIYIDMAVQQTRATQCYPIRMYACGRCRGERGYGRWDAGVVQARRWHLHRCRRAALAGTSRAGHRARGLHFPLCSLSLCSVVVAAVLSDTSVVCLCVCVCVCLCVCAYAFVPVRVRASLRARRCACA